MKVAGLQTYLTIHQRQSARPEAIAVELRKAGILPKGGRGAHAPSITLMQAVEYICAHASVDTYKDAVKAARGLPQFENSNGKLFGNEFIKILENDELLSELDYVLFVNLSCIRIVWRNNKRPTEVFLHSIYWEGKETEPYPTDPMRQMTGYIGRAGFVGAGALRTMMMNWDHGEMSDEGEIVPE